MINQLIKRSGGVLMYFDPNRLTDHKREGGLPVGHHCSLHTALCDSAWYNITPYCVSLCSFLYMFSW